MKRSNLKRRKPLSQRVRRRVKPSEAQRQWMTPAAGFCECCGRPSWRLHRHHVLLRQIVHREGADEWAAVNGMLLHPDCHANHHSGFRKIPVERVPEAAVRFTVAVLGEARAADYFRRRYDCSPGGRGGGVTMTDETAVVVELCGALKSVRVFSRYTYGDPLPTYALYFGDDGEEVAAADAVPVYIPCERERGHTGVHLARGVGPWAA